MIILNKSGNCSLGGKKEKRNACRFLVRKREGKEPLRKPCSRWENIKLSKHRMALTGFIWFRIVAFCGLL
jgi:hypothetical protein